MCASSFIADHYHDKFTEQWPQWVYKPQPPTISVDDFNKLKAEVEEMKKLLRRANDYDAATGQPDCAKDEKVDLLRHVAKVVGVSLDDVLKPSVAE